MKWFAVLAICLVVTASAATHGPRMITNTTQCEAVGGSCSASADCDLSSNVFVGSCDDTSFGCCISKDDVCVARNGECLSAAECDAKSGLSGHPCGVLRRRLLCAEEVISPKWRQWDWSGQSQRRKERRTHGTGSPWKEPSVRPSAARVLLPPTVTSPATSSSAAATTPVSAAAYPKTSCVRRGMANVCRRPNAMLSPTIGPPVCRAPTESAVCQGGHFHEMAPMGHVRAVATKERTADAWVLVPMETGPDRVPVEADQDRVPVEAGPERVPVEDVRERVPVEADPDRVPVEVDPDRVPVEAVPERVHVEGDADMVPVETTFHGAVVMVTDDNRRGLCT
ncbi:hypothetical protein LSAT2_010202 [Lamellibrachia satsuma]|nr:hypothetical protein LSAT2_010202 [Lamellibrachia satsuma]